MIIMLSYTLSAFVIIKQLKEFVVLFIEHVYFKIQTQTIATCQLSPKNVIQAQHTFL